MGLAPARHSSESRPDWSEGIRTDRHIVKALSVRTLFDATLSELPPEFGDTILMTAVNISDMFTIAEDHGYKILGVDIDPETLAPSPGSLLRAQRISGAKICVVTHLFGAVNKLDEIDELRRRGVFVIEDLAQSFNKEELNFHKYADCSLVSFGPIKRYTSLGLSLIHI